MRPQNISGRAKGYNDEMFVSDRAIRSAFRLLGYGVNMSEHKVARGTVTKFQKDYNKCSKKFKKWGKVDVNGRLDKDTLNALEMALRWAKRRENKDGTPSARVWQSLCSDLSEHACAPSDIPERGTNYVEVMPNGMAKLHNIYNSHALRANILEFEKHGPVVFAKVEVPPQGDLPKGGVVIICPCVFSR